MEYHCQKLKVDWTYHSNSIEGSTLTLGETFFFISEGLTVEGKPFKDFLDAKNHIEAIDYLYELISNKRDISEYGEHAKPGEAVRAKLLK